MIEKIIKAPFKKLKVVHIRMAFSQEMDEVGRFKLKKVWHLICLIIKIYWTRFRYRPQIMYYPPAGPEKVPMYRDIVLLISTRWMFKKTVFHFHAGGLSSLFPTLSRFSKWLFRVAYNEPDACILLSELNPPDDQLLNSRRTYFIPYGIEDRYLDRYEHIKTRDHQIQLLYVGVIRDSKGVTDLVKALSICSTQKEVDCTLNIVGKFHDTEYEDFLKRLIDDLKLNNRVHFMGVLTGDKKWHAFANADIFCFPTFFESETFGLVVLEAMQFKLPVIATNWRGVPSLIKDGESGFIVPVNAPEIIADKVAQLAGNPVCMKQMGRAGRARYMKEYNENTFYSRIESALLEEDGV